MDVSLNDIDKAMRLSCGFFSEEMLQSWFSDLMEELILEEFKMAIYKTTYYMIGKSGKQVFFSKDSTPFYETLRCGTQYL